MRFFSPFSFLISATLLVAPAMCVKLHAQSNQYPVSAIADSLLKEANSVVRLSSTEVNVKDPQNATVHYHEVYTVLNQKADDVLTFSSYNSNFRSLSDANIHVYNKEGLLIQKYSKKDLMSTSFGPELIDDGSYTYFKISPPSYPITVEYDYKVKYKGILRYPTFAFQAPEQSVEKSTYLITLPTNLGFRYKSINTSAQPQKKTAGLVTTYNWGVQNIPAVTLEKSSGPAYQYLPVVLMAADQFSMDDYAGKMDTWGHFGDWLIALNKKDAALKPDQIAFYQSLTASATTPEAKARIIYDFLQRNMRYVSIQLGIGSWKPLPAALVSTKKYGDCKALSHFMQAALGAVGIESYPALINMSKPSIPVAPDFPMNCFNHEVLCIPHLNGNKDTTWLECTSQLLDFGTLGYETAGNYALLLTPDGGKLIQAPPGVSKDNILNIRDQIQLHKDGSANQQTRFAGSGAYKDLFLYGFYQQQQRDKKSFINDNLGLKSTDSIQIVDQPRGPGPYTFDLNLKYDQYPDFSSGNKLFVSSRPFSRFIYTPDEDSTRSADYYFSFPRKIQDTTVYQLDQGLSPESIPDNRQQSYDFGDYTSHYSYDAASRKLTIVSQLEINRDRIKATEFKDLVKFATKVAGDIEEKIVILKE